MSSQRENNSWFYLELKLNEVNSIWRKLIEEDLSLIEFDDYLCPRVERMAHANLIVSGPMVDLYIKDMGQTMHNRLCRGKVTGLQSSVTFLVPWQVMVYIIRLSKCYGAYVESRCLKAKEKLIPLILSTECCAQKIWNPKRCGRKFLIKRRYSKSPVTNTFHYAGCSKVVIAEHSPLVIKYKTKTQKASMSFYVQHYDRTGVGIDAALAAKVNLTDN